MQKSSLSKYYLAGTSKPNLIGTKLRHKNLNNSYKKTTDIDETNPRGLATFIPPSH